MARPLKVVAQSRKRWRKDLAGLPTLPSLASTVDPTPLANYYRAHLEDGRVYVEEEEDMHRLYNMGFFGKGTLSRGEPDYDSYQVTGGRNPDKGLRVLSKRRYLKRLSWRKNQGLLVADDTDCEPTKPRPEHVKRGVCKRKLNSETVFTHSDQTTFNVQKWPTPTAAEPTNEIVREAEKINAALNFVVPVKNDPWENVSPDFEFWGPDEGSDQEVAPLTVVNDNNCSGSGVETSEEIGLQSNRKLDKVSSRTPRPEASHRSVVRSSDSDDARRKLAPSNARPCAPMDDGDHVLAWDEAGGRVVPATDTSDGNVVTLIATDTSIVVDVTLGAAAKIFADEFGEVDPAEEVTAESGSSVTGIDNMISPITAGKDRSAYEITSCPVERHEDEGCYDDDGDDAYGDVIVLDDSMTEEEAEVVEESSKSRRCWRTCLKRDPYPIREHLQLSLEETFFLVYGLGCMAVRCAASGRNLKITDLWRRFRSLDAMFVARYVAYHYYRSRGWVLKTGLKYGADFLLYKKGPGLFHSSYSILVRPVSQSDYRSDGRCATSRALTWRSLACADRVVDTVVKEILYCYVIRPRDLTDEEMMSPRCLNRFQVAEVHLKRWVPKEERDKTDVT